MLFVSKTAQAEPQHGIAAHGMPALAADFPHLPYVNDKAPKGGRIVMGAIGSYDSLNPYVLRGRAPWQIRALTVESLMARSWDEPFTLYGLIAETVETAPDRSWVAFTLREAARFSDGSPITVEDVIWSLETLGTKGHPRYRNSWKAVERVEQTGPRSLKITFAEANRELPMIMGLRPILQKAQWEGQDFQKGGMTPVIGSGPYVVAEAEAGRALSFERNRDWWGKDLPINRGLYNFDEVKIEFFRNEDAFRETLNAGLISLHAEYDPVRWAESAVLPAVEEGRLIRDELTHRRPTGLYGFVFNTRRAVFADRQVREALAMTFDWEWVNKRLYRSQFTRIESAFGNSDLGFSGPASPGERAILSGFDMPEGTLEQGWRPLQSDGSGRDRKLRRRAAKLLDQAGWRLVDGERQKEGETLRFEVIVNSTEQETLASLWSGQLQRLGVEMTVRRVDDAQFEARRTSYDYDMIVNRWAMSLSPGTEQRLYFASQGRKEEGTRNYMGAEDPAIDAAIDALLAAESPEAFRDAVRALDRMVNAGVYVVPFGALPTDRILHDDRLKRPDSQTAYGWWGWAAGPARWWVAP
ncbi:MAG: extracellular solute-binding protein [Pseudomonadota bacterium]